jgi:hypothetical protein
MGNSLDFLGLRRPHIIVAAQSPKLGSGIFKIIFIDFILIFLNVTQN